MIFELVKNSLRAVQERCMDGDEDPPPIRVVVADGLEDVTIKVCFKSMGRIL
jgi:pyruvate dehydrogenase kinase 2/3/4